MTERQFSHIRFTFLLILILNTLDIKYQNNKPQNLHRKHFERDINYCDKCFRPQVTQCMEFFKRIEPDEEEFSIKQLLTIFPEGTLARNNQMMIIQNTTEKIFAKYLIHKKENLKLNFQNLNLNNLKEYFLQEQQTNLDGMQFTPLKTIDNFVHKLQEFHVKIPEITIWLYMIHNIQPALLPLLYDLKFPVPKSYAVCGFTIFQENSGLDLYHFYRTDFHQKLKIAQQLLKACIKFSYGLDNYRLYITDLTADNIVYNAAENRLTFIDLDTIFIVDAKQSKYKSSVHKYQYMECPGCFAYAPEDISSHNISDINIYSACQFLREDLYGKQSKGFLYPIPEDITSAYPDLWALLNKCVDCPDNLCQNRFPVAEDLIELFQKILLD